MTLSALKTATFERLGKAFALAGVAAVIGGLVSAPQFASPNVANADDSVVTLAWAATDGPLAQFQPGSQPNAGDRIPARTQSDEYWSTSGHYGDFKDLKVTVSKTKNLTDEIISIEAEGMNPTVGAPVGGTQAGNYLQIMQCWGPDPMARDFYETCQFGSRESVRNVSQTVGDPSTEAAGRGVLSTEPVNGEIDGKQTEISINTPVPFRTVKGQRSTPAYNPASRTITDGVSEYYSSENTNEQPYVPFGSDGKARIGFQVQSGASQRYLGCGMEGRDRCWLVIVPRGMHSGFLPEERYAEDLPGVPADKRTRCIADTQGKGIPQPGEVMDWGQLGSPISPNCANFWNRMVIPLDFAPVGGACAMGASERRINGTEFFASILTSWGPALCANGGASYSFTSSAGDQVRQGVLSRNDFGIVADELKEGTIGSAPPEAITDGQVEYGPLANASIGIGFTVRTPTQAYRDLKMTPRLVAKMITQSYDMDIPWVSGFGDRSANSNSQSRPSRKAACLFEDPEWQTLNPAADLSCNNASTMFVTPLNPDDATRVLWTFLQQDADARAFLEGKADPWGMSVNPYYLPQSNPNAAGGQEENLATDRVTTFPRSDQSVANAKESGNLTELDSLTFYPYVQAYHNVASNVSRGFRGTRNTWDDNLPNPNATKKDDPRGDWEKFEEPLPGGTANAFGAVNGADANAYQLATAVISPPQAGVTSAENVTSRPFVPLNQDTITAAAAAATVNKENGHSAIPAADLPPNAYPLTFALNATLNVAGSALDESARNDYAALMEYAAGPGQVSGSNPGQLPIGYAPLNDAQKQAAAEMAKRIKNPKARPGKPDEQPAASPGGAPVGAPAAPNGAPSSGVNTSAGTGATGGGAGQTANGQAPTGVAGVAESEATPSLAGQIVLGVALLLGLGGAVASPFLLRRRGVA